MFMQMLALGALVGALISYRRHRSIPPVLLSIVSTALIIYGIRNYLDTCRMPFRSARSRSTSWGAL